jgi:hypothetical protein
MRPSVIGAEVRAAFAMEAADRLLSWLLWMREVTDEALSPERELLSF